MSFAQRINRLKASPIRETLHLLDQPGMVSFAGGLPAEDSFPALSLKHVPKSSLQYGASEGDFDLREQIAVQLKDIGFSVNAEQVFILSGSQQGIDLVAKLFVEKDTPVAVEAPTYLAALQVFELFGAKFVPYAANRFSSPISLSEIPRVLYVNPTFQNPTGYCYDAMEREQLADLCKQHDIVLFEDDPYRDLVYETCERRPIATNMSEGEWIYQSSFSKTFAPGLRLGYLVCSEALVKYFSRLKQATDLHANRLSQYIILEHYFKQDTRGRLARLRHLYRQKRDLFEHYLKTHLGDLASWSRPKGGLFFWLTLNSEAPIDTRALLVKSIEKNVAFMPGEPFFATAPTAVNQMRLNFSLATEQQADEGLAMLRECLLSYREEQRHGAQTENRKITKIK